MVIKLTRIIGSMVLKNEKDRYLEDCIRHAQTFLEEIYVYDDRSSDGSAELVRDLGCRVVRRPDSRPSFINHEGLFRYSAWKAFEQVMSPEPGDWVLSFDADEFLVTDAQTDVGHSLDMAVDKAKRSNLVGINIPFPEIFKIEDGEFFYRTDGFWGKVKGPRLFEYRLGGTWTDKSMGCGSEPQYVFASKTSSSNYGLHMLHLGYAKDSDKEAKYKRYSSLAQHGHNDSHIESILKTPTLKKWTGTIPQMETSFE